MHWNGGGFPILTISSLLIALQVCGIGIVLRRNRTKRFCEPLSTTAFQRELERIFSRANEWS